MIKNILPVIRISPISETHDERRQHQYIGGTVTTTFTDLYQPPGSRIIAKFGVTGRLTQNNLDIIFTLPQSEPAKVVAPR